MNGIKEPILTGTIVAGTLDISAAFLVEWSRGGRGPADVLRVVASGPLGDGAREAGLLGALAGLVIHYGLMAAMVTVFVLAARAAPALLRHPVVIGLAYGSLLYIVMYWAVLPMRWPAIHPVTRPYDALLALSFHMLLVGVPIALIAARHLPCERRL
jgi:hypothetical protein